ncbi:50S ribosomal protein L24 [Buchnera aphidicola]|uniref:Large ribosomal subunit protein uL24 n=2 Tax=Buchnera aphidicola (Cinara cedri) TaxID=261318 RepID=RL24_BUCCC|nr:50S ribosomal protein L24 [Buchnera aphidicola]Q057B5.1 RecName: Full=Large ribosomal subunit protein uL24; AltName: Full=50S ribosomal protein L24 [Buchnera aphidicola BCc]AAW72696.1 ribosomal protein L24 [Buchnera aphidicola (Cinara cedri)]ABJ90784.1 50S ribosomal protein L24 [Buchnera aphidicola BCc]
MSYKIRSNDLVIVLTGKDKGKVGIVKKIYRSNNTVIVEGINIVKKHQKSIPEKQQSGGIISKELPIHISNVSIFNKKLKKSDKVEFFWHLGKKKRRFKSNKELIQ